jgi:hypothetical protein
MTFDLPPLQGALLWVAVPRVETLAESSNPFGARHFVPGYDRGRPYGTFTLRLPCKFPD